MAFTTSLLVKTVLGDKRVHAYRITADAATQAIDTGLDYIDWFSMGFQSMSTAAFKVAVNEGAAGTSTLGSIGISGAASGDEFFITVYGR
jgi:hypothetical protein